MTWFQRTLVCAMLALVAGTVSYFSVADEQTARSTQWAEAAARQVAEAQRRQREAWLRWEYERRRSAAHARMPNTLYASTPSNQAHTDLACPALVDDDIRRLYRDSLKGQGPSSRVLRAPDLFRSGSSSKRLSGSGVRVFAAQSPGTANTSPWSSKSTPNDGAASHKIKASGWAAASVQPKSAADTIHHIYLVPSASEPLRQGFVRVINHSAEAGEVRIDPVDDGGRAFDSITLSIDANETVHFNSGDLENGNEGKGLTGSTGSGEGDWRLAFTSDLDIEVLAYIRTTDGFLTAMHDVAPTDGDIRRVAIFNPGGNKNQVSRLRLLNPTDATAEVTIRGTDDKGMPGSGEVSLSLDAGTAKKVTAELLEQGGTGLAGTLGDGSGKWRLEVESEQAVVAMSLLESPTDHLTNLSTVPEEPVDGVHNVPLFPAAGDDSGRQGFVRVINNSGAEGDVSIKAYDETERNYEPLTLTIGANEVVHFNSDDLEQGSPQKGLSGGTGAGEGDWRLELTSDLEIEVLSYIRTTDGFLTAMHDVAPSAETRHRVAVFNPGSNRNQESLLRLINPDNEVAEVTITGIDDWGSRGESAVSLTLAASGTRTVGAWELESGGEGFSGALGDGSGKWQLTVTSDVPVVAMSLLKSPTGHLTNLSTAPVRGARGGAIQEPETAEAIFQRLISGPIVQSKCINCHVEGGASGNTPLVFVRDDDADHLMKNLKVFEDYLANTEGGAERILNKIQGALAHGGGVQVASGTEEYRGFETLMELLGAEVETPEVTVGNLFDGVRFESPRRTLWRAAIVFAGRIPTTAEYAAVKGGGEDDLRRAIRGLMQGPEFHEFLVRGANDRLLTDREASRNLFDHRFFVEYLNKLYRLQRDMVDDGGWGSQVEYGAARAPLELIAYVVESDLPYTEILTANYIMANPMAAEAYGAATAFDEPQDAHEFRPSEIVSYYRQGEGQTTEYTEFGPHITNPGPLATDYPHAGILNTKAFLQRFPSTATNRNRARSRWTYYHFLGFDIEKSEARTMKPEVLKDRNNPTMRNPACTVCHSLLDPVAGAYQNYGAEGFYKDQFGGVDSLDDFFRRPPGTVLAIQAESWSKRETLSLNHQFLQPGDGLYITHADSQWGSINLDRLVLRDDAGSVVFEREFEDPDAGIECFGVALDGCSSVWHNEETGESDHRKIQGEFVLPLTVPALDDYDIEIVAWADQAGRRLHVGVTPYRVGDRWYRDMRQPGFGNEVVPDEYRDNSLQWLAQQMVTDDRFAEAAVKFWWPAIMGSKVAEQPEDASGGDYAAPKLAADAQTVEVGRLATQFQLGFGWSDNRPYNLKDLLVEIVMTRWFRAAAIIGDNPLREMALQDAGAERLLTPEELARKTASVTGYSWGRWLEYWRSPHEQLTNLLTRVDDYRLLFGGIDSDSIIDRLADISPTMFAVANSHASSVSCPIIMREFYLFAEDKRILFKGLDTKAAPVDGSGEAKIRKMLVDLHARLLGVDVDEASQDVESTFELFLDVWDRKRMSDDSSRFQTCDMFDDADMFYFSGILEDGIWLDEERGSVDWDVVHEFYETIDWSDDLAIARTWVVVLAYLLSDYRYMYL